MNLSKALKIKSRLVGELNRIRDIIRRDNSHKDANDREIENRSKFMDIIKRGEDLVKDIVAIKAAIARSNIHVYEKIFYMDELKSFIDFIRTVNVMDAEEYNYTTSGERIATKRISYMSQDDIDNILLSTQREINEIQDELDEYNGSTIIKDINLKTIINE